MKEKKQQDNLKMWRKWGVIFVCFALIFALAPIGMFAILAKQRESAFWPHVQGTIIVCEIEHRVNEQADRADEEDEYRIDFMYQYTVENETYENDDIYYWSGTGSEWDHTLNSYEYSLLRDYPVGSNVTVYYNPEKPHRSCLITGENPDDRLMIIFLPATGYIMLSCIPLFYFADKLSKHKKGNKKEGKSFITPALEEKMRKIKEETES